MSPPGKRFQRAVFKTSDGWIATLYLGDCVTGMAELLAPESVDVVVTSPPYNIGVQYTEYSDSGPRSAYLNWIRKWAKEVKRVLADNGSLFLNIGAKPSDPWVPFQVALCVRKVFVLQNVIHWVKSIAIEKSDVGDYGKLAGNIAVGHFKPVNGKHYLNNMHEFVFHFTKKGAANLDRLAIGVEYQDKSNIKRWKSVASDRRCRGNVWFVPYKTIKRRAKERPHPATFPVELARKCILLHGLRDGLRALDPFLGIGHAALAARSLGVDFIGFEIDQAYFERAVSVMKSADEQLKLLQVLSPRS